MRRIVTFSPLILAIALLFSVQFVSAQSATSTQLRSTIQAEVSADPRSQSMSSTQINAIVDSLTAAAEAQGITSSQLTYRPSTPASSTVSPTSSECSGFACSVSHAFGLDGSIPILPIALFVAAALFILIFSLMREMGHPHAQFPN